MSGDEAHGDCFEVAARLAGCFWNVPGERWFLKLERYLVGQRKQNPDVERTEDDDGPIICHAYVTHPYTGERHTHAWVETTATYQHPTLAAPVTVTTCHDYSNGHEAVLPQGAYYNLGRIRFVARYTVREAQMWMHETKIYGPWEPELLDEHEASHGA